MKKVKIGKKSFVDLWKEHKGLMVFLFVGGAVLALATMAPGAWATPNQNPLRQTLPPGDLVVCDERGVETNLFCTSEFVYVVVKPGSFTPGSQVDCYVVVDQLWIVPMPIPADVSGGFETIVVNAAGAFGPPLPVVWPPPLTPGVYDIVCDANRNGIFDNGDAVDDAVLGGGFVVEIRPVGGIAMLPDRFNLLAPWVGLAALVGVMVAAVVVRLRRQG
jgi:hypothetical protein